MAGTIVLKVIGSAASGMAALRNIQGGIDDVVRASKVLGAAFTAMAAAGGAFIKSAAMTAARTQVLGTSLRVVAEQAGFSEGQIAKLEAEIKDLGITTQNTRQGLIRLIQSQVDLSKSTQLARTAQDLAVIAGENSSVTYDRLVRAIATMNPRLLRMTGIVANLNDVFGEHASKLDPVTKKQMLMDFILKEGEKVAGVYAMAMGDVGKAITSLPRYFEELRNAIGKHFLPILKVGVDLLSQFLKWFNALPESAQRVIAIVLGVGTAFAALMGPLLLLVGFLPTILAGFSALVSVLPVLLPVIAGLAAAVGLLVAAGALLAKAWKENWGGIQIAVTQVVRRIKGLIEPLVEDVRFWLAEIKKAWAAFVAVVRPLVENLVNFVREKLLFGSGLPEFLTFLRDVVNVALKMVTQFLETLRRLVAGEDDAWDPLYDALLNVMTLIALAWKRYVSKALTWGWNLVVELATGMAKAARAVLTEVVQQIGNLIQSFLGAFSPPKKGPLARITEWGRNLIDEYIKGFALADFGAIRDALSPIQQALEAAVRVGDIEEPDMLRIFREVRGLAAELFAEFRKSGEISAEMLERIGDALGEGAQDYVDYIRLTLEHQAALDNLRQLEDEVVAARAEGYVPQALQDQLDAAREEVEAKKEAVDWQREMLAFQQESVDIQARLIEAMEKLAETMTKVVSGEAGAGGVGEMSSLLDEIAKKPAIDLAGKLGLGALSEEFEDMKKQVKEFFENLPKTIEDWLDETKQTILDKWDKIKQDLQAKWVEIQLAFFQWMLDVIADLQEKWDEFKRIIDDTWKAIKLNATEDWEEFKRILEDTWKAIKLKATEDWDEFKRIIEDTWKAIKLKATEEWEEFKRILTDTWKAIQLNVETAWTDITTAISDAWTEIETFLTEIDLLQIGKDAIQGLLDGMKEAWEGIKAWIGSRVDDLPQWIKDALGITSPPDWAIQMGEDIVAGLQAGLDLSGLQDRVAGAVNVNAFAGAGGLVSPTVVFASGAFAGAFPGVKDGRDAGSVMTEVQRMVEDGYLRAQVPGGVSG